MHGFLSQIKVFSDSLSLSLTQFFNEFFIHSSIYANLLIFRNPFFFFFFFCVLESICSFSHGVFSGSLLEFKKRFSLYFSLNFLINFCIHSSIYANLLIFGNSLFFFFYTRIIMLIFSLNLIR